MDARTSPRPRRWSARIAPVAALGLLAALAPGAVADPKPGNRCEQRVNDTYDKLLECMTVEGVREHQAALQKVADANDDEFYPGSRAAGTKGYADSVAYVSRLLDDAGYDVSLDRFEFRFVFPALLQQMTPTRGEIRTGTFTGSGTGDVTGAVVPVDLALDPPRRSTSGCEASDFTGVDLGGTDDIALVQRGGCSFADKARKAEAAGAEAVVIVNQGDEPARGGLVLGTLGGSDLVDIPVVGASFADGVALARPGATARVRILPAETRTDYNVIAELPGAERDNVVMAGSHLDSVTSGPGINDNGSGSAAVLETALLLAGLKPENTLRFAFWGGEELGLLGSTDYVEGLSERERDRIALYQNYDMIGSPNPVQQIYDADQSTFPAPVAVPVGSEAIEDLYARFYTRSGVPYDDAELSGRSDYQAFVAAGVPSGGLFTGAEAVKSPEQAAIWGGTAGQQLDPCYHRACDSEGNVDLDALDVNSDLVAFSMLTYAYSTQAVNGIRGKKVPGPELKLPEPAGPEGTYAGAGGGAASGR